MRKAKCTSSPIIIASPHRVMLPLSTQVVRSACGVTPGQHNHQSTHFLPHPSWTLRRGRLAKCARNQGTCLTRVMVGWKFMSTMKVMSYGNESFWK